MEIDVGEETGIDTSFNIGDLFDSIDLATQKIREYAKKNGFSSCKSSSNKNYILIVCSKSSKAKNLSKKKIDSFKKF